MQMGYCLTFFKTYLPFAITIQNVKTINVRLFGNAPDALKNANLKIMMKISAEEYREYLGASMNLNGMQSKFVVNLKPGQFIAFEENLDQPVYLELPMRDQWLS